MKPFCTQMLSGTGKHQHLVS